MCSKRHICTSVYSLPNSAQAQARFISDAFVKFCLLTGEFSLCCRYLYVIVTYLCQLVYLSVSSDIVVMCFKFTVYDNESTAEYQPSCLSCR